MAGIYIHIPFCRQACHYCDFHFSTHTGNKTEMVQAIGKELRLQKDYLGQETVHTIYFGGGTPSLLTTSELQTLLSAVYTYFTVGDQPEITLEANPDDLSRERLLSIRAAGINRLSIGIQSFHEPHLRYLNRAHSAQEAIDCVKSAQDIGLENMSIDLIYAIPADDHRVWEADLQKALSLQPPHISSYCLTIEEKTVFGNWLKKAKIREVEEDFAAEQFEMLETTLKAQDYEQYEISNFCQSGAYSRHNSNYWNKEKYLGVGPSAHSYDGKSRQYNVAHNIRYLKALSEDRLDFQREELQPHDQINEYILTGLRTRWGCNLEKISREFSYDLYQHNKAYIDELIYKQMAGIQHQHLILTNKGKLLADRIASDLFVIA